MTFDTYNPTKEDLIANAPEGATHYLPENDDYFFAWLTQEDNIWFYKFITGGSWHKYEELADKRQPLTIHKNEGLSLKNQQYIHNTFYNELLNQQENPTTLRERILEIRKEREAGINEEQELIDKLASMGFKLIEDTNEKLQEAKEQHDLQDWRNWEVGDILTLVESKGIVTDPSFTVGKSYQIHHFEKHGPQHKEVIVIDDSGEQNGYLADSGMFKFHSRPTK